MYCLSRQQTRRRKTHEVRAGTIGIGGDNPIRIQSMTTSDTRDIAATTAQCIALAEAGSELVRITAPNTEAARALREIRRQFTDAGFARVPLVADIHFLPAAAMEAVEHVEKVRINPGNYADKKKFDTRTYTAAEYALEIERLHAAFTPLVQRAKTLGRSLRIGVNHGSLSDRILNRYGDTPEGMVESALEFLRIARDNAYDQIVLSMKSSNPKIVIQAYRQLARQLAAENMTHPLHLGVTEAGDGEDARIKSAIGIGTLLCDGLGDTLRVSLTEDSVNEIPVARQLADLAQNYHIPGKVPRTKEPDEQLDPYHYTRRQTEKIQLTTTTAAGANNPPRVILHALPCQIESLLPQITAVKTDTPVEALHLPLSDERQLRQVAAAISSQAQQPAAAQTTRYPLPALIVELPDNQQISPETLTQLTTIYPGLQIYQLLTNPAPDKLPPQNIAIAATPEHLELLAPKLADIPNLIITADTTQSYCSTREKSPYLDSPVPHLIHHHHVVGTYRAIAAILKKHELRAPLWIRNQYPAPKTQTDLTHLLETSILTGSLLCDGLGDLVSIETPAPASEGGARSPSAPESATPTTKQQTATGAAAPSALQPSAFSLQPSPTLRLTYNILQAAGARITKTEYISCPSCGRTLFDLQTTTRRIREKTSHLKGVKIAIMGCIVNGPGEMADADFGYVGGAPGKINLYVNKQCVQYNIPAAEADDHLISLIKTHNKWTEPE